MAVMAASKPLLPAAPPARASACSQVSVVRYAEGHRNARIERDALQPASRFTGDVIEMRRFPAHHCAQSDDRVESSAPRELHRRERKFKSAGYVKYLVACGSGLLQSLASAYQKFLRDRRIKARDDDGERESARVEILPSERIGRHRGIIE